MQVFPSSKRIKCGLTYTPLNHGLPHTPSSYNGCSWMTSSPLLKLPSAQSSFAWLPVLPSCQSRVLHSFSGHYSAFITTTNSCARPNPSHRFRSPYYTVGLCRLSSTTAGRWPFPTLSLQSLRRCLDPYPAMPFWCICSFLPRRLRLHVADTRFAHGSFPAMQLQQGVSFEAAVIRLSSGSYAC